MVTQPRIDFLYTNIGRGHPFYLDGILEALIRHGDIKLVRSQADVFEVSKGVSKAAWKVARWLYQKGSSPGLVGSIYQKIRAEADYNHGGLALSIMGRDIRKTYHKETTPLIVAHPTLVAILKGKPNLIYQHGEVVTPHEAVVAGATMIMVPTESAAEPFLRFSYKREHIFVTGLCIEPALVRQAVDAFEARRERIERSEPLVGAFFSSGAEPKRHVEKLVLAAASSAVHGGRIILFVQRGGEFNRQATRHFVRQGLEFSQLSSYESIPHDLPQILVIQFTSRRELNHFTAQLFPTFDYIVAPPHERTNWGLGLGLPMFIVEPAIGPFSPLNRDCLMATGVAEIITSNQAAVEFGQHLGDLRSSGRLAEMADAGWGKYDINGFEHIARFLLDNFAV
jgi:hypothetical protein